MANKIAEIEGIGAKYAELLSTKSNIKTVQALLKAGAAKKGRKELAEQTGIDESDILRWVNMADLFRIKGVAEEYSDLLEKAGVDTVKELRTRNADNLHAKIVEVCQANAKLVRRPPSKRLVEDWIQQAKGMEPMVTH